MLKKLKFLFIGGILLINFNYSVDTQFYKFINNLQNNLNEQTNSKKRLKIIAKIKNNFFDGIEKQKLDEIQFLLTKTEILLNSNYNCDKNKLIGNIIAKKIIKNVILKEQNWTFETNKFRIYYEKTINSNKVNYKVSYKEK